MKYCRSCGKQVEKYHHGYQCCDCYIKHTKAMEQYYQELHDEEEAVK